MLAGSPGTGAFVGSQVPFSIHFMPTWSETVSDLRPAGGYGLAFFKDSRVAALVDHDEAVCAVRKLRCRAGQCSVIVVVMGHAKNRAGRSRVTDGINLQCSAPSWQTRSSPEAQQLQSRRKRSSERLRASESRHPSGNLLRAKSCCSNLVSFRGKQCSLNEIAGPR